MREKKWTVGLFYSVVITIGTFAGIEYWLDPMLQYGKESGPLTSYEYAEMYSNPGIAKHYDYNAVMVGTSMVENTDVDLCDELFGVKMVRLPYSGGTTYNMKTILDVCFSSHNNIQTVYWELDEFQMLGSATEPRYPLPMYLYRTDHREDVKYLLNLDIFYRYTLKDILGTIWGDKQKLERRGITLGGDFGREEMLATYSRAERSDEIIHFEKNYKSKVDENLKNIRTLLEAHPSTKFVFFMPPFSVLYWDNTLQCGTFDANMDAVIYVMEKVLEYDNTEVFFYQGEEDVITNLDNYKDYSHYGSWINDLLTKWMAQGVGKVTKANYVDQVNQMRTYIKKYNFTCYFKL